VAAAGRKTVRKIVVAFYVAFLVVLAFFAVDHELAEHWAYITLYVGAAAYAALNRAWLACSTAISVAVLRTLISFGIEGIPFFLASITFAALFFVLIISVVHQRRKLDAL
jgi:hypothetical protein